MNPCEKMIRICWGYFCFWMSVVMIFIAVFCLLNWIAAVGEGGWRDKYPPYIGLYLSVPGTFAAALAGIIFTGNGSGMFDKVRESSV